MKKPYRFSIIDETGDYLSLGAFGYIQITSTPYYLKHAPIGWEKEKISWNRSIEYHGLQRTHTTPYEFVGDAAKILRYLYQLDGTEGVYTLVVEKLNDNNWLYDPYYSAEIDFSVFSSSDIKVKVNLAEGGIFKYLRGNNSTTYEIPIENSDCLRVFLDGLILQGIIYWVPVEFRYGNLSNSPAAGKGLVPLAYYLQEGDFPVGEATLQMEQVQISPIPNPPTLPWYIQYNAESGIYFFKAWQKMDCVFHLKMRVRIHAESGGSNNPARVRIHLVKSKFDTETSGGYQNEITAIYHLYTSPQVFPGTTQEFDIIVTSPSFTLDVNEVLTLQCQEDASFCEITYLGNPDTGEILYEASLEVRFKNDPSVIRAYRTHQVMDKIVDKLTEGKYTAESDFLSNPSISPDSNFDNIPYQTTITCGDAIRSLETDKNGNPTDPKIKTTFDDFYKAIQSTQGVGLGVEYDAVLGKDKIVIEPIEYFYKYGVNDLIIDIGEVDNIVIDPAKEFMGNLLKIGYEDQEYDKVNGRDEFNTTQEYKYPIRRINKEVNMISPYRADMYGIEFTRANLTKKKTTDSGSDNDSFFISINDTPHPLFFFYLLLRYPGGIYNNALISPNKAFNIDLSPKRCLLRNGRYIRMQNYPEANRIVDFQTSKKNAALVCDLGWPGSSTGSISESSDVDPNTLKEKCFLPIAIKVKTSMKFNILDLLKQKPYGYIGFSYKGYNFKAFPFEISVFPATNDIVEITLLPTPDTNVLNMMHAANNF